MKYKKQIIYCIITFFLMVFILICFHLYLHFNVHQNISSNNGVLNLKNWNDQIVLPLNGDWEFYWEKLIYEEDIKKGVKPDVVHKMPVIWNRYKINGKNLPGFGYGTYRLNVTGVKKGKTVSFFIPTFSTAYRFYINNQLLAENGQVSKTKEGFKPEYNPKIVTYSPTCDHFNVIIQVSNFTYARGGMWYSLYLSSPDKIADLRGTVWCRDLFFLGSFFMMFFIYFSIFLLRRKEKGSLYFAILCGISAIRTMLHGSYLINLIPFVTFGTIIRLDYFVMYWFPVMLGLLLWEMFKEEMHIKLINYFSVYAIIMSLITLFTPVSVFTHLTYFAEFMIIPLSIYLFINMLRTICNSRENSIIILNGCLLILFAVLYDIMFQSDLIAGGLYELTPIGFFVFLMVQAFVLARHFTSTIHQKEVVLAELIESTEREQKSELKFFKSQIRPHFIYNSLNTIISISRKDLKRSQRLLIEFSHYLRGFFDYKDLDDVVQIESELEFVRSYVTLEQARFGEKLHVEYDIADIGLMLPPLVLQPLVENAVVHGIRSKPDGGNILVYVKDMGAFARVGVKDDGVGIDAGKIERLINGMEQSRSIGIFNITNRLKKLYQINLSMENIDGGGLDVHMDIPRNMEII